MPHSAFAEKECLVFECHNLHLLCSGKQCSVLKSHGLHLLGKECMVFNQHSLERSACSLQAAIGDVAHETFVSDAAVSPDLPSSRTSSPFVLLGAFPRHCKWHLSEDILHGFLKKNSSHVRERDHSNITESNIATTAEAEDWRGI